MACFALRSAGRGHGPARNWAATDVIVLGFDDLADSIELMKEGWIEALAVQQPYEIGKTAVETMVAALQGNGPEEGRDRHLHQDRHQGTPSTKNTKRQTSSLDMI